MEVSKVVIYITHRDKLLVFRHTQFPEAGIQVPGGSIEVGEFIEQAAIREAEEETGLTDLELVDYLGEDLLDLSKTEFAAMVRRYFFHLVVTGEPKQTWIHYEYNPSDGSPAPIEFEFFWVKFPDEVPKLSGERDVFLDKLTHRLMGS